jgi:C1A family cysteine protease
MGVFMKKISFMVIIILSVCSFLWAKNTQLEKIKNGIESSGASWVAEETDISKLSVDEKKNLLGGFKPIKPDSQTSNKMKKSSSTKFPSSFNWGNFDGKNYMTTIKNQGQCGSCWAFSIGGVFEARYKINSGKPDLLIDVSEQMMVSCWVGNCIGSRLDDPLDRFKDSGLATEKCFSYFSGDVGKVFNCANKCKDWKTNAFFIKDWNSKYKPSIKEIKDEILNNGPVMISMAVYDDFFNYSRGVYTHILDSICGYHAIVIYGWSDGDSCWLVKNSWGWGWGELGPDGHKGWFRIKMGVNESECEDWVYWLTPSVKTEIKDDKSALLSKDDVYNSSASKIKISYYLDRASNISLKILNVQGKVIKTYFDGMRRVGRYQNEVDVSYLHGGCYLVRLSVGNRIINKKITIVR